MQIRLVLQRLDRVEQPQVNDVTVGAARRLVDELDVPPVCRTRRPDFWVILDAVRRCIVVVGESSLVLTPRRPAGQALMAGMVLPTTIRL